MTLIEEIEHIRENETEPCTYSITKSAKETIEFYAKQMNRTEDDTLDILLRYLALTENCNRVLNDLGYEFDSKKTL